MTTVLYVCPRTALKVQGLITDGSAADATSVSVDCPICNSIHFVTPLSAQRQSHPAEAAAPTPPQTAGSAQAVPSNMAAQFALLSTAVVVLLTVAWLYLW